MQVSPWLIAVVTVCISGFLAFAAYRIVRAHRRQVATGKEELIGKTATVKVALKPEGTVLFKGELWAAELDKGQAEVGEKVIITRVEGLQLYVTKEKEGEPSG